MKVYMLRLLRLVIGLFICAVGITLTIKANIGYSPWDVLHSGIAAKTGLKIGFVSILAGICVVGITLVLKEKIGIGTIINMVLIGIFIDVLLAIPYVPECSSLITGLPVLLLGQFFIAVGVFVYLGAGFSAGPRDGLMVGLTRLTRLPVGICRSAVEISAVLAGWLLGGSVGVGTLIAAFIIGYFVQLVFAVMKINVTDVKQETLDITYNQLKAWFCRLRK